MTASIASPPYVLRADGSSLLGRAADGRYRTATTLVPGIGSTATDFPTFAALGGGALGRMGGPGSPVQFAMGAAGLRRLLDVVLPEQQLLAEDHIGVWNPRTGLFEPGFPAQMNDLQFFGTPAFADVTGDGRAEVLAASAMYDLAAYSSLGLAAPGFPKRTGGWSVSTPGVGDMDGDGRLELALATREEPVRLADPGLGVPGHRVAQVGARPPQHVDLRHRRRPARCGGRAGAVAGRHRVVGRDRRRRGVRRGRVLPGVGRFIGGRGGRHDGGAGDPGRCDGGRDPGHRRRRQRRAAPAVVALAQVRRSPTAAAPTSLPATGDSMPVVLLAIVALAHPAPPPPPHP